MAKIVKKKFKSTAKKSKQPIQRAVNEYLDNPTDENIKKVFDSCESLVWWYINYLHVNKTLIPDVLQESRLTIWRVLKNYSPKKAMFTTYLHKNIMGVIKKYKQRVMETNQQEVSEVSEDISFDPWPNIDGDLNITELVKNLSELQQSIIQMIYFEGLSASQAAKRLGLSSSIVRMHHRSALGVLRESFLKKN